MDALIYTAMSGAERAMRGQQVHANNLANLDTNGFRANLELAQAANLPGYGYDDRHMSQLQANAVTDRQGALRQTGRDLDIAISGNGYFAVDAPSGEACLARRDRSLGLQVRPVSLQRQQEIVAHRTRDDLRLVA